MIPYAKLLVKGLVLLLRGFVKTAMQKGVLCLPETAYPEAGLFLSLMVA
jgi:hypothetical protein